jgi:phosphatidylglycerophosphatase A
VLEEVRTGATNAETAVRPGVSPLTVKYHVSNILGKLELRNRRQIATWEPERVPVRLPQLVAARVRALVAPLLAPFALVPKPALGIAAAAFAVGAAVSERLVRRYRLGDEPSIVVDEIAGCWLALATAPKSLMWAVLAYVLFRIGDIVKPWPISLADRRVHGGLGIMLDDVLAGIFACIVLHAVRYAIGG